MILIHALFISWNNLSIFITGLSKYRQNVMEIIYNFCSIKLSLLEILNVSHGSRERKRIPDHKKIIKSATPASAHKVLRYGR